MLISDTEVDSKPVTRLGCGSALLRKSILLSNVLRFWPVK